MAFLLAWRLDGGMEHRTLDGSLGVDVTVMGAELTNL